MEHERPIILVHGILGQRHLYWNIFKQRLIRDGFRVHEVILPYGMFGDMRIAAGFIRDKVEATLRGDHVDSVDIICHSAGGLVARYYMKFLGGDKRTAHLITMGTPHQGTYFSYMMGFPLVLQIAKQARPQSHFLEEISGPGAIPATVRVTNIWSPIDGIVLPSENARLPGAHNIKMPWSTHWGFLWRKDVYEAVREALRVAPALP